MDVFLQRPAKPGVDRYIPERMPIPDDLDREIRTAAFIQVRRMLELRDPLTSEDLARGSSSAASAFRS